MLAHFIVALAATPALRPHAQAFHQDADSAPARTLVITPRWEPGLRYAIELTKEREDWVGEKSKSRNRATTPIDVAVTERSEDGFVCSWTFGETKLDTSAQLTSTLATKLASMNAGWALLMRLDAGGSVTGLVDEGEARAHLIAMFEEVRRELLALASADSKAIAAVEQAVSASKAMIESPAFASTSLREPRLFYRWCGAELVLGESRAYEDQLPNPLGGDPLPALASVTLTDWDEAAGEATLEWRQSVDPEKTAVMVREFIRSTATRLGKPEPKAEDVPRLEIEDEGTWVFDLALGLPKRFEFTRRSTTGDRKRVETVRGTMSMQAPK